MRSNYKIIQLLAYTKLCYDGLGNSLENTCTALIPKGLGTNALNCRFSNIYVVGLNGKLDIELCIANVFQSHGISSIPRRNIHTRIYTKEGVCMSPLKTKMF
jgi:hypothetical protein